MSTIRELDLLLQGFVDKGLPGCGLEVRQRETSSMKATLAMQIVRPKQR